jgi:exonuclease III
MGSETGLLWEPVVLGYLTNFLWVDTYRYAHDFGEKVVSYTWQDYMSIHNLFDIVRRVIHGLWNVCIRIRINEKVPM